MNNFDSNMLFIIVAIILIVLLIISLIKKAIKVIIFIVIILLAFSAYKILIGGVNPKEEINTYKTNIEYGKEIASYTGKIKKSVDIVKQELNSKKFDQDSVETIKEQNKKLEEYQSAVENLPHSKELDYFHDKYCEYLNSLISGTNAAETMIKTGENASEKVEALLQKLNLSIENLTKLEIAK